VTLLTISEKVLQTHSINFLSLHVSTCDGHIQVTYKCTVYGSSFKYVKGKSKFVPVFF